MKGKRVFFFLLISFLLLSVRCGGGGKGCSDRLPFREATEERGGKVVLAWDSSSDPNLAGYKVYYGTTPGVYPHSFTVGKATQLSGNVTTVTIEGLKKGQKYYMVITAYDIQGKESGFSNEVAGIAK